jgi:hypothetical protein
LSQNRRTSRDYERLCATGEAFIYVAMSRLMVWSVWLGHEAIRTVPLRTRVNRVEERGG